MIIHQNITTFFDEVLDDINCQPDTKSYIIGIFSKYKSSKFDLSKDSITLLFAQAREKQDFSTYQNIGDWIFFINSFSKTNFKCYSKDYYSTIAKLSYYSCYKLINKQWKLFEELADNFTYLEEQVRLKSKFSF